MTLYHNDPTQDYDAIAAQEAHWDRADAQRTARAREGGMTGYRCTCGEVRSLAWGAGRLSVECPACERDMRAAYEMAPGDEMARGGRL